ncbi:MAG: carbohydrate-binding family V/XII, partial [Gammaproteobacteria bacterium]
MQRLSGLTHLFLSAAGTLAFPGMASAIDWPQEITADEGTIVVYQPQPERLDGNRLSGRAAMSLELDDQEEAIFGAFWFDARIDTDTDADIATIRDVSITQVRWPGADDAAEQRFSAIVEAAVPETGFEISLERLSASLGDAANVQRSLDSLNTDPPQIVFSRELAVLLLYDGDPRFADIEDSGYERALNTPFAVARDKRSQRVYLSSGTFWYAANGPMGPFAPTESPPDDLARMVDAAVRAGAADADGAPAAAPAIVVATQPTELIVTDGNPDFQTLPGGDLLYVQN